jgi:hypothetical protein
VQLTSSLLLDIGDGAGLHASSAVKCVNASGMSGPFSGMCGWDGVVYEKTPAFSVAQGAFHISAVKAKYVDNVTRNG